MAILDVSRRSPRVERLYPALALVGLAVAGLAIALYLAAVAMAGGVPACGSGGGCETVAASDYSRWFGIPVAVYGVAYSSVSLGLALSWWRRGDRRLLLALYGIGLGGVVVVLYLRCLELFVIGAICTWCLVYGVTIVVGWLATALCLRRSEPASASSDLDLDESSDSLQPLPVGRSRGRLGALLAPGRTRPVHPDRPAGRVDVEIGGVLTAPMQWCPACSRPLGRRENQCPGCGAWLVFGVLARLALAFLLIGVALGLVIGTILVTAASRAPGSSGGVAGGPAIPSLSPEPSPPPSVTLTPSPSPAATSTLRATPAATPVPTPEPTPIVLPGSVAGALQQCVVLDEQLGRSAAALNEMLASKSFSAAAAVAIVRKIAADSTTGLQVAPRLRSFGPTIVLGSDLEAFYGAVSSASGDALGLSLADNAGYRAAVTELLAPLQDLPGLGARTLDEAAAFGLPVGTPGP